MTVTAEAQVTTAPESPVVYEATSRPASKIKKILREIALRLIIPILVLAAWWYVTAEGKVSPLIVPAPKDVVASLKDYLFAGLWNQDMLATAQAVLWSFVIALVLGIALGAVLAFVASLKSAVYPYILAFQSFPKIAIAPLLVVSLGYGDAPKIIIGASIAIFPIISATMAGLVDVDPDEHALMRSIGAKPHQELRHLRLPRAMSYVFPSLDVAVVGALLGVITAEIVGTEFGLGRVITERAAYGDSASVYALLIVLAVAGALLHSFVAIAHRLLPRSIVPK